MSSDSKDAERSLKNLRFPINLEVRFAKSIRAERIRHFIISAFVALIIYNIFAVSDWFILPDMRFPGLIIRLAIISPIEFGIFCLLYRKRTWFVNQPLWKAEGLIIGSGLLAVVGLAFIISLSDSPLHTLAHAGFAPMLVYGNVVQKLRFRSALVWSAAVLLIHCILLASGTNSPQAAVLPILQLNLATAFFSLVSNYEIEYGERKRFLMNESEKKLIDALDQSNKELDALSRCDALTGCANRRHALEYLNQHSTKANASMSAILIDVDHFKAYNDHYGHPAGDTCLRKVATTLEKVINSDTGLVVRWGGEEFLIMLPELSLHQSQIIAENIRAAIQALSIPHAGSQCAKIITVSVGVACASVESLPETYLDRLQEQADKELYKAKAAGRNRISPQLNVIASCHAKSSQ
ncbi:MAG: GGDEF domain-containing protein [Burkholderiales bacterium]|nr:GGDEF domain-containing protein [Burkholderiales bacterium]